MTLVLAGLCPAAVHAAPSTRYEATRRGGLTTTGNALGLAGTAAGPTATDGVGVFTDASGTLQVPGWPLGTTLDWTLASSEAVLDLPAGATVVHAQLVWAGTVDTTVLGDLDHAVALRTPSGASYDVAPTGASAAGGSMALAGYYARSADVTALIEGAGTYRVGEVPCTLASADAAAGWALYVAWVDDAAPVRRVAIATFMEAVGNEPAPITLEVPGVCVPQAAADRDAHIAVTTMEGDPEIAGDSFRFDRTEGGLAGNGARVAAVGAPLDNAFGGHIMRGDGALDGRGTFGTANHGSTTAVAGARQGWDVITFDGTGQLGTNWTSAWLRASSGNDSLHFIAAGLALDLRTPLLDDLSAVVSVDPTVVGIGGIATLTVNLHNSGDAAATNVIFRPPSFPTGVAYVPVSFEQDGAAPPGGPVGDGTTLIAGVTLRDIAAGATSIVTLRIRVTQNPPSPTIPLAPSVSYTNEACPGTAAPDRFDPGPATLTVVNCGNGIVEAGEGCDDGDGEGLDGCSAACQQEPGWTCDEPAGTSGPSTCTSSCGDGAVALGAESCDDGDRDMLDGCSATCALERGWNCQIAGAACTPIQCGDGIIAAGLTGEACDDGNAAPDDGCSATCVVEDGWGCVLDAASQGTPLAPDSICTAICGDGRVASGAEACDDGDASGLDGCSGECQLERGWTCGDPGAACAPIACGDGLLAVGAETCDDGGVAGADGCDANCQIEPGFDCATTVIDGDPFPDSICTASCGDGRLAVPVEACDDGDRGPGDGCSSACTVEPGWVCSAAPGALSVCTPDCGDGVILGGEACDDGNTEPHGDNDPDGCAADCAAVDHGWSCDGEPSVCVTTCGDSQIGAAVEVCDDSNSDDGDGCAGDCAAVERGWSCGDPPLEPSVCEPRCGDGFVRGVEGCDDGDLDDGDGCSADCREEDGWLCEEADADSASVCARDTDDDGVVDPDDNCPDFYNPDQDIPFENPLCPPYRGPRMQGGGGGCAAADGSSSADVSLTLSLSLILAGLFVKFLTRRRRGSRGVASALTIVPCIALAGALARPARAQHVDPQLVVPALSPTGLLSLDTSATPAHLDWWAHLIADYANDELVTRTAEDATAHGPLNGRTTFTLAGGMGLFDRFEVALGLPILATTLRPPALPPSVIAAGGGFGDLGDGDVGLGDLRVTIRGRMVGPAWAETGFGLALVADLTLPTSGDAPFTGERQATFTPRLVADFRTRGGLAIAANLAWHLRPPTRIDDLTIDDEFRFGVGAELPLGFDGLAFLAELDAAFGQGASAYDHGGVAARETPIEILGGVRWRAADPDLGGLVVTGAFGSGVSEGYGAPDFRVHLSVAIHAPRPAPSAEPLVPADHLAKHDPWDQPDGTNGEQRFPPGPKLPPDEFDKVVAADPDNDADGVRVPGDQCPDEPEDHDGFMDSDGCPDPDNDEDGVVDAQDKCPDSKEVVNGIDDADGCADEGTGMVTQVGPVLVIADKIRFKSGSAELLESDKKILDQVVGTLRAFTANGRVRIEGHTDNRGDREFNVDLAERRAWSVLAYMVEKGIPQDKLFAKGFGSTRPIATNNTDAGRAQNRRVEFHIVKPGEPDEGTLK